MAHTFANLSFETAGASPGLADGWTVTVNSTVTDIVDFGGGVIVTPFETYDWFTFAFDVGTTVAATFLGSLVPEDESFEVNWGADDWSGALSSLEQGLFNSGVDAQDTFEMPDWGVSTWTGTLGATASAIGSEDFSSWVDTWRSTIPEITGPITFEASSDTATQAGSWTAQGFRYGDICRVRGTALNNVDATMILDISPPTRVSLDVAVVDEVAASATIVAAQYVEFLDAFGVKEKESFETGSGWPSMVSYP